MKFSKSKGSKRSNKNKKKTVKTGSKTLPAENIEVIYEKHFFFKKSTKAKTFKIFSYTETNQNNLYDVVNCAYLADNCIRFCKFRISQFPIEVETNAFQKTD